MSVVLQRREGSWALSRSEAKVGRKDITSDCKVWDGLLGSTTRPHGNIQDRVKSSVRHWEHLTGSNAGCIICETQCHTNAEKNHAYDKHKIFETKLCYYKYNIVIRNE
jgi:hypothetical protein